MVLNCIKVGKIISLNRTLAPLARSCFIKERHYSTGNGAKDDNGYANNQKSWGKPLALLGGGALLSFAVYKQLKDTKSSSNFMLETAVANAKKLPVFTSDDVADHSNKDTGIWVSYKNSVYDISEFVDSHPGGEKILLGAGGPIDPFWNMYAVHQTPEVLEILDQYKIGQLDPKSQKPINLDDPFANDPYRLPVFRVNSKKPFNAEPPVDLLTDTFITPNELFYVRNHLPVPNIDPNTYRLEVKVGQKTLNISLDELKTKYKPVTITTTLQCAGNRREEMSNFKTVKGLTWGPSAIGTARWTGVRLRDILLRAGIDQSDPNIKHIQFDGIDDDITKAPYGASVPKSKAMNFDEDVIVAYQMNGVDIPKDHGYPVRAIVPGYVGARNVKWLHKITASDEESRSHWQRNDYKGFSPSATFETADYSKTQSIQELPVISVVSSPSRDSTVDAYEDCIDVKGYAWSGGGRDIIRVDVSADGGKTWQEAKLTKDKPGADDSSKAWAWTLWDAEVKVKPGSKAVIVCKAIDSSYNSQPENIDAIWNLRGFLTNTWHRVPVKIADDNEEEE